MAAAGAVVAVAASRRASKLRRARLTPAGGGSKELGMQAEAQIRFPAHRLGGVAAAAFGRAPGHNPRRRAPL